MGFGDFYEDLGGLGIGAWAGFVFGCSWGLEIQSSGLRVQGEGLLFKTLHTKMYTLSYVTIQTWGLGPF